MQARSYFTHKKTSSLPVMTRFLMREILYPGPINSKSTPESVVPSQRNWMAAMLGVEGPEFSWNFALTHPWLPFSDFSDMPLSCQMARLFSEHLCKNYQSQNALQQQHLSKPLKKNPDEFCVKFCAFSSLSLLNVQVQCKWSGGSKCNHRHKPGWKSGEPKSYTSPFPMVTFQKVGELEPWDLNRSLHLRAQYIGNTWQSN